MATNPEALADMMRVAVQLTFGFDETKQLWREGKKFHAALVSVAEATPWISIAFPPIFPVAMVVKWAYEAAALDRREKTNNFRFTKQEFQD